jgi:transcriptional regulator with XRE-family HTH domain
LLLSLPQLPTDPAAWKRAGQRVANYRAAHGTRKHGRRQPLTQAALAERVGVSQGCLQAFENATRATRRESVTRIAAAVDLTVDQLFAPGSDAPAPNVAFEAGMAIAGHHTDEALAIADLFTVAHTEVRTLIKQQLVDHVAHRRDYVAVAMLQRLRAAGVVIIVTLPGTEDPRASTEPVAARGSTFRRTAGADRDPVTGVITAVGH